MDTAVVILNWNGVQFLQKFMPTVEKNTANATIVVIDNQSTDNSIKYLTEKFPQVEIIVNNENGGFAKGYNDGLAELKGRFSYYVLLNSDIEVTPNWLSPLLKKIKENPKIVAVQPKVLSYHKKSHFEYAGASGGFIDKNFYPFCRGRMLGAVEEDQAQYNTEKEVFWTTGACMLVNAECYHELGGLDEDFFAHMEEIDFCWRAKKKGYSLFVIPQSTVYHVGGGTLNYDNPRKTYLNFRNSLFMIHKNYEGWLTGKILQRFILDGIAGIQYLITFKPKHTLAVLKAHLSYYKQIPTLNAKRKEIKKNSTHFNPVGKYDASLLWAYYFKRIKQFSALNHRFFN